MTVHYSAGGSDVEVIWFGDFKERPLKMSINPEALELEVEEN